MTPALSYPDRLAELAVTHAEQTAIVSVSRNGAETALTYEQLELSARRAARLLAERGTDDRCLVVLAVSNSLDHVVATQAAWKLGACVLPLSPTLSSYERGRILRLAQTEFTTVVMGESDGLAQVSVPSALVQEARDYSADELASVTPCPGRAIASGGSTGAPKLIVDPRPLTYVPGQGIHRVFARMGYQPGNATLVASPLYHAGPFRFLTATLVDGGTVVLMEKYDAAQALQLIEKHSIEWWATTPLHLLRMARSERFSDADLSSLRAVVHSSAPCPTWLKEIWIDRVGADRTFELYIGSEENGCTIASGVEWMSRPGTVGKGYRTSIRIVDTETGTEVGAGDIGEVFLRSEDSTPGGSCRYVGDEPLTATPDGFSSLGDVGHLDADGYLFLADRRADLILSGGVNVYPAEVEAVLLQHPAVADAVVVGLPDAEWGQRVHGVVLAVADPSSLDVDDVLRFCRERLSGARVPKSLSVALEPFRDESGKVRRQSVAEACVPASGSSGDAPRDVRFS